MKIITVLGGVAVAVCAAAPLTAQTLTAVGPYAAVIDRATYAKPPLPLLGPAGSAIVDPVFRSTITRITDRSTRPDNLDRSYKTPSSTHQNAWSAAGSRFYVTGGGGAVVPYSFDRTTGAARRIQPSATGAGGLILNFYMEPQFSYVNDAIIYGSVAGGSLRTIDKFNFDTSVYSRVLDLDALIPGLSGTYIGGLKSSAGVMERVLVLFGGTQQDLHHYAAVFEAANPQNRQILDTKASTLNGTRLGSTLNFMLHGVMIDRSGRYVMLYPTSADQTGTRKAPQSVAWDTQSNVFTEMPISALPYGHDAFGYGVSVNQDCCTSTAYDAAQWQFRALSTPLVSRDLITTILPTKEVYLADHTTWNNARPDNAAPVISGLYRYGVNTAPWRAWDDEIIAVQTDAAPGVNPTVWRFAHHRSNVANDLNSAGTSFWYMPRPNISPDGHWVLFTSNWEKTLGTDPDGDTGGAARQDVFLVALQPTAPVGPPPASGVSILETLLAGGRATVAYLGALTASGGSGGYRWNVTAGAMPFGLTLDLVSGTISGTPSITGISTFTVTAADAIDPSNAASAVHTIAVANAPVVLAIPTLAPARISVLYSAALQATGGSGLYTWSVASGGLPSGLVLDAGSGAITGTPLVVGLFQAVVTAADRFEPANNMSAAVTIQVGAGSMLITTASLPPGRQKVTYAATLQASGGTVAWSITGGALPPGLFLNAGTGAVSGIPTLPGVFNVTVRVTDVANATNIATADYAVVISAAIKITSPRILPQAKRAQPYTYAVLAANIQGVPTWDLAGGAMPPGMTLNPATGVISGICVRNGQWSFNARVKDGSTNDTLTLTLKVK